MSSRARRCSSPCSTPWSTRKPAASHSRTRAIRTRFWYPRGRARRSGSKPHGRRSVSRTRRGRMPCRPGRGGRASSASSPTAWPRRWGGAGAASGSARNACLGTWSARRTARRARSSSPCTPTSLALRAARRRPTTAPSSSSRCDPEQAARPALPHRPEHPAAHRRRARARARRRRGRDRGGEGGPHRDPRAPRAARHRHRTRPPAGSRDAGCEMREPGSVTVVEGDSLRLDWHALVSEATHPASRISHPAFKVIGNIPYSITSPLIDKALTPPLPARIVFLVQVEVADRIAAPPGSKTYGALSVGAQAVARVERVFTVRAGAFTPPPKVTSAVVRLTPLAQPLVAPEQIAAFRAFVTARFARRRKQLRNVVMAATGRSAAVVTAGLAALGLDPAAP